MKRLKGLALLLAVTTRLLRLMERAAQERQELRLLRRRQKLLQRRQSLLPPKRRMLAQPNKMKARLPKLRQQSNLKKTFHFTLPPLLAGMNLMESARIQYQSTSKKP